MTFPTNSSPYGANRSLASSPGASPFSYLSNLSKVSTARQPSMMGGDPGEYLFGNPEKNYQQSTLGPEQQSLYQQLLAASQGKGAGGAFGDAADYYRSLLEGGGETFNALAAPEMRRFREQIIPDLAEQFAGMGSGGLSSSGFRNAAVGAGTDLSERLAAIRAGLRQQGAEGIAGIGRAGLTNFNENILRPRTFGMVGSTAEAFAKGAGQSLPYMVGG